MKKAIEQAKLAYENGDVPIGCVIVKDDEILSQGYNQRNKTQKIIDHAEIIALTNANETLGNWNLEEAVMYVTVEPCLMCFGAIYQSRIKKIYVSVRQDKVKKMAYSKYIDNNDFKIKIVYGLYEEESRALMKGFFNDLRKG